MAHGAHRVRHKAMLLALLINLYVTLTSPVRWLRRAILRRRPLWLHLRLDRRVSELPRVETPVLRLRRWLRLGVSQDLSLADLRQTMRALAIDPAVVGVIVEIPHAVSGGWSDLVGLHEVLVKLRAAGKRVVAHLPDGGGTREVYLAAAADAVWIAPEATLALLGVVGESVYLKPLLERLGVSVQVQAAGRFKTAAEPLVADSMSEGQRIQRQAILDNLHAEVVAALRTQRGLNEAQIADALSTALHRGAAAVSAKLADGVCYADELVERLGMAGSATPKPRVLPFDAYDRLFVPPEWRPLARRRYVAVVPIHGTIGLEGATPGGASVPGVTDVLARVRRDKRAAAVVLHIDSPGGSALASDHIHREVARLAKIKPVVACFGNVAASGGYYVAAPARRIVAQPTTVTGSIGVISAKVVVGQLLQKIGLRPQVLSTAAHADMFSMTRELDEDERGIMEREAQGLYRTFLGIVADGRGRPVEEIEVIAAGRVWSGRDALANGLVDALGGLDVAIEQARGLVEGLGADVRDRLEPRMMVSVARSRQRPAPAEPANVLMDWIGSAAPELSVMLRAKKTGECLLMLAPDLGFLE